MNPLPGQRWYRRSPPTVGTLDNVTPHHVTFRPYGSHHSSIMPLNTFIRDYEHLPTLSGTWIGRDGSTRTIARDRGPEVVLNVGGPLPVVWDISSFLREHTPREHAPVCPTLWERLSAEMV